MADRPKVHTRCVADQYSGVDERIIEFNSRAGGGLVSFRVVEQEDGVELWVDVYRTDPTVKVLNATEEG